MSTPDTQTIEERQRARKRQELARSWQRRWYGTVTVVDAMLSGFDMPDHVRRPLHQHILDYLWCEVDGDVVQSLREQVKEETDGR